MAPLAVVEVRAVFALPRTITGFDEAGGFLAATLAAGLMLDFAGAFFANLFVAADFFATTFLAIFLALFLTAGLAFDDFEAALFLLLIGFFFGTGEG